MQITKKQLTSTMIVLSLISNITFAADLSSCPNAVSLHVGDTVKDCPRVGLSVDYEKTVRKQLVESDFDKKIIDEQAKILTLKDLSITNLNDQSKLWKDEAQRDREQVDKERARTSTSFWVGLGVGIATVLASAWAVKQVAR